MKSIMAQAEEQIRFVRDLVVTSDAGYFGITISNESPAVVDNVKPGGPADVCGLRKGDKIVLVNGSDVTGMLHKDVVSLIKSHASVTLRVQSTVPELKRSSMTSDGPSLNHAPADQNKSAPVAQIPPVLVKVPVIQQLPMEMQHSEQEVVPDSSTSGGVFSKAVKRWSTFHGPRNDTEKKTGKKGKKDQVKRTTQVVADLISAPVAVNLQTSNKLATLQQFLQNTTDPAQLRQIEEEIAKLQNRNPQPVVNNGAPVLTQNGNSSSSLTSTLLSQYEESSGNTRTSGVSIADDNDESTELVFESIENAKERLARSRTDFPSEIDETETAEAFLGTSRVRNSASLNDLAEEPGSLSEGSPKTDEIKTLDDHSLRSSSSGVICGTVDSLQISGTSSGQTPSVTDNLNTKSRQKMMNRLKQKRSNSSDDVRLRSIEQENNLPDERNEKSQSQLVGNGNDVDDVDSLAEDEEEPATSDATLVRVGDDDFVNSLTHPNGETSSSDLPHMVRPAIPIINFDEDDQPPSNQPKFQPILPMESPSEHENVDVIRHQSTASFAAHPAFKDAATLSHSPSHCLIVLRFMYTRDTQSSLLFYLISNKYFDPRVVHPKGENGIKEKMSWAVELHSTFTAQNAPWPIPEVPEPSRQPAETAFRNEKSGFQQIDAFFKEARLVCERKINDELKLFQAGVTQGFGDHYGVHLLLDPNVTVDQLLDELWMKHVEQLRREDAEKSRVLLSALCTIFSQFQCRPTPYEKWFGKLFCQRKLKKPESKKAKGHLCTDFLYTTYPVACAYCQKTLFGPNHQGMRCEGCNLDFHDPCLLHLTTECAKRRAKIFPTVGKSSGLQVTKELGQLEPPIERNASPDQDNRSASPMPSSLPANLEQSPGLEPVLTASDEELADDATESDPSTCYHRVHQGEIRGREQSRQCAIHELWRIELYHVHKLRLLHDQVILKIHHSSEPAWSEAMRLLFPNLPRLIQEHSYFYNALKQRHQKQCPFQTVGDILLDVVSGDRYHDFVNVVAECLEAQAENDKLWQKLRSERRFTEFIAEIERQTRLSRKRRQVESLKVAEMQLIARYKLLIEGIIKYSDDEQEKAALKEALTKFVQIADEVNTRVGKAEKRQQKRELEENLVISDKDRLVGAFPFLESPKTELGELIHCGDLSWKLPTIGVPVRVYLFAGGVVLICVRRGNSLELKMHTMGTPAAPDRPDPAPSAQGGSTFHQLPAQKFMQAVEFCPVIEIGPKTTINGTREASSKERIDIRPDKSEVKIGTPVYRFCFVGAGPRDASSEWDEWTHYLTQIQSGQQITRFKPAPKPVQTTSVIAPTMSAPGTSPQPPTSANQPHSTLSQHLSSSSMPDASLSVPEGPPVASSSPEPHFVTVTLSSSEEQQPVLNGHQDSLQVDESITVTTPSFSEHKAELEQQLSSDTNEVLAEERELELDQKQALDSFIFSEGTDNNTASANGSDEEQPSAPPMPASSPISIATTTSDPLLTPEFVSLFGFKDAKELTHFGSFYLAKPIPTHSPLARTASPKFTFPTIGALMSPKQPSEIHEHLLCLSLEINKLANLALANANTSHYGTPPMSGSRVSFSAGSTDVDQIEQTIAALRRRMEVVVSMSGRTQRSNMQVESNGTNPPIPL